MDYDYVEKLLKDKKDLAEQARKTLLLQRSVCRLPK